MTHSGDSKAVLEKRVCVFTRNPVDSAAVSRALASFGVTGCVCLSADELKGHIQEGVGALVIAEEAVGDTFVQLVSPVLSSQPPWSDIPIILVTAGGEAPLTRLERLMGNLNINFLERPFQVMTLVAAVRMALRSRERQYEVRDLIATQTRYVQEIKQLNENLERTVEERTAKMHETIQELEAVSYSLSHDMRGPLRAMRGYSEILEADYGEKLGDGGTMLVHRIANAATRLDQLIRDVLSYSRVVRSSLELHPVSVEKIARQLIDESPELREPVAHVEVDAPTQVLGHEAYLTQVLSNLLYNAVKFVPKNRKPEVRLWTEVADTHVRLSVRDNGIGIPKDAQRNLFQMFYRAHGGEDYEGTGIGLAIVRKAVDRMNGRIGVESEPGKGSTFWVELQKA
jgi:signal transduction histidine kinase